eukprot:6484026-Amphidinium_carterae.1
MTESAPPMSQRHMSITTSSGMGGRCLSVCVFCQPRKLAKVRGKWLLLRVRSRSQAMPNTSYRAVLSDSPSKCT